MAEGLELGLEVRLQGAALRAVRGAHVDDGAARPYPVALDQAGDARARDDLVRVRVRVRVRARARVRVPLPQQWMQVGWLPQHCRPG